MIEGKVPQAIVLAAHVRASGLDDIVLKLEVRSPRRIVRQL